MCLGGYQSFLRRRKGLPTDDRWNGNLDPFLARPLVARAVAVCRCRTRSRTLDRDERPEPQPRAMHSQPRARMRYQRSELALMATLTEMYTQGVSTRKVKAITEELIGHSFSAPSVSAVLKKLDGSSRGLRVAIERANSLCRSGCPLKRRFASTAI